MRTTLKTTTAVLACLNLAVPYPAIAQTGTAPGAAGPEASSVCATDPDSQECRDEIARDLAEEEAQAEESADEGDEDEGATGEDQAPQGGDAGEPSAPPASATEAGAEEGQDPSATEADDADEQTPQAQETPDAGASEGRSAAEDSMSDATPQAESDAGEPSGTDAPEAGGADALDAAGGEPLSGDLPEAGAESDADAESGDVSEGAATSPTDAGEGQTQAGQATAGDDSSGEAPAGEESASDPGPIPAPEEATEGGDASAAASDAAPISSEAPEAAPTGEMANRNGSSEPSSETDSEPSGETDAEAVAGASTEIEADDPANSSAEADQAVTPEEEDDAQPTQQRDEAAADAGAEVGSSAEGEQPPEPIAAAAADEGEAEEVTTETVTEETARSSDEDFETQIDQSPEASSDEGDDDGLSNLEKALLVGAGALAVGTLLRNGREVVASSDDRVVVSGSDGSYELIKDDNALLRRPGSEVQTETYGDGSTRTIVNRADGSQIITIRDPELRVVRRVRVTPEGQEILLIDDTEEVQPVDVSTLQARAAESRTYSQSMDQEALRQALAANQEFERSYSLNQVRSIEQVREQVPAIDLETITFASGSAAIQPEQADQLAQLGQYIANRINENPREIFLVEGHTDAVGDAAYNLALSDRRAESVALALTEYFEVPPENLVVQGYGEQFLKVETEAAEQANRRASIRRITPLLQATVVR